MLVIQKINLTYFKTFFGEPPTAKALCTYESRGVNFFFLNKSAIKLNLREKTLKISIS